MDIAHVAGTAFWVAYHRAAEGTATTYKTHSMAVSFVTPLRKSAERKNAIHQPLSR